MGKPAVVRKRSRMRPEPPPPAAATLTAGMLVEAIDRLLEARIALGDATGANVTTTAVPLAELRLTATQLYTQLARLYADITAHLVDDDPTALATKLVLLREGAARTNLCNPDAACGFYVGFGLALLAHDLNMALAAETEVADTQLRANYKSLLNRRAQQKSLARRTQASDTVLAQYQQLLDTGLRPARAVARLAHTIGCTVVALKRRLTRARIRQRQQTASSRRARHR